MEYVSLPLAHSAFIRIKKLDYIYLLAVLECALKWLVCFKFDQFKFVFL